MFQTLRFRNWSEGNWIDWSVNATKHVMVACSFRAQMLLFSWQRWTPRWNHGGLSQRARPGHTAWHVPSLFTRLFSTWLNAAGWDAG